MKMMPTTMPTKPVMIPTSHIHLGAPGSLPLAMKPMMTAASGTRKPSTGIQEKMTRPATPAMKDVRLRPCLGPGVPTGWAAYGAPAGAALPVPGGVGSGCAGGVVSDMVRAPYELMKRIQRANGGIPLNGVSIRVHGSGLNGGHRQRRVGSERQGRRRMPGSHQLRAESRDHRAIVGAQCEWGNPQLDAMFATTLFCQLAHPGVGDHPTPEQQSRHVTIPAGGDRLGEQHIDDGLSEA